MNSSDNPAIVNYLNSLSHFQKEIVLKIREVVLSADKNVMEDIKWGSIAFFNKKNICGFRLAKNHVTLLFMEGASLEDKFNILEGSGKKARTIKISQLAEIPVEGIKDLVQQAITLEM